MTFAGLGSRLCTRWTRWYTLGLPADIAAERQAEIASDLWDHEHDADEAGRGRRPHDLEVVARVLAGMPADVSWRREILRSQPRTERGGPTVADRLRGTAQMALLVLSALGIAVGTAILPLGATAFIDGFDLGTLLWVLSAFALSFALLAGLLIRAARPVTSTGLLVIGSLAPSVAVYWLPPVYLLTVGIALLAVATTPNRLAASSTRPGPGPVPT